MRPAVGQDTWDRFQTPPPNSNGSLVVLDILVALPSKFVVGDTIMARDTLSNHTIYARDITNLTIQSNTSYTSWYLWDLLH
jgi:hypothetical protein